MSVEPVGGPPLTYPIQPIKPVVGKVGGPSWGAQDANAPVPTAPPSSSTGRLLDMTV